MQIENNTVISLRYTLKNDNGEILEDNTTGKPIQYLHGSGSILPLLEEALEGLQCCETKSVFIPDENLRGNFYFDVIIDGIRLARPGEITTGKPIQRQEKNDCGPGCCC